VNFTIPWLYPSKIAGGTLLKGFQCRSGHNDEEKYIKLETERLLTNSTYIRTYCGACAQSRNCAARGTAVAK
jgi:hypothetical protein